MADGLRRLSRGHSSGGGTWFSDTSLAIAALLEPLLPRQRSSDKGHPYKEHRQIVNGMLWILHTGASWRDLPPRYGAWESVYSRFRRWTRSGLWDHILAALQREFGVVPLQWTG